MEDRLLAEKIRKINGLEKEISDLESIHSDNHYYYEKVKSEKKDITIKLVFTNTEYGKEQRIGTYRFSHKVQSFLLHFLSRHFNIIQNDIKKERDKKISKLKEYLKDE